MFNEVLRVAAVTSLLIVVLHFIKFPKWSVGNRIGIAFTVCVIFYLLVDSQYLQDSFHFVFMILLSGAFLLPFFFWLLAKAIFDDHLKFIRNHYLIGLIILTFNYFAFLVYENFSLIDLKGSPSLRSLILFIPKLLSLGFIALSIHEALKGRAVDLVDERIHFRNLFVYLTASVIGATLVVEVVGLESIVLESLQKIVIVGITWYFLYKNTQMESGFFFNVHSHTIENFPAEVYPGIVEKVDKLLKEQQVYKTEGITIKNLADLIGEQEYKLRRTINGEMGYRNFNDFINRYRVEEACQILQDPNQSKLTIQEISYQLGYQSIGPFNKAFKEQTGQTPTVYRRAYRS